MIAEKPNTKELFYTLSDVSSKLAGLALSFSEEEFYKVPFENSWTAAQVCEHIIKSNKSIENAIRAKGELTNREPDERVPEVKETFLNFTRKFQSPQSVLPTETCYDKNTFVTDLDKMVEHLNELNKLVNLHETIEIPGFGSLSKLELFHFIVYHSQRHIHQLENISRVVINH